MIILEGDFKEIEESKSNHNPRVVTVSGVTPITPASKRACKYKEKLHFSFFDFLFNFL